MKRQYLWAAAMALGLMSIARGLQAAPLDDRIPADAVVYAGWAGADALAPKYAESNLKGFVDNTTFADYVNENWADWMEKAGAKGVDAKQIEAALKVTKMLWQHAGALYIGPVDLKDIKKPTFKLAFLIDAGADAAVLMNLHKKLMENKPMPPEVNMKMTLDGSVIILSFGSASPDDFKAGAAGRLPGSTAYIAATKGMQKDPAIALYVDAAKIVATIEEVVDKAPDAPPEAKNTVPEVLKTLGLTGLTQVAMTAGFDHKEWTEQAFIGTTGPRVGLLGLLEGAPISDATLAMVPKDVAAMNVGSMDLMKVLALVRDVIKKADPKSSAEFEKGLAEVKKNIGIDIETNLINALGDVWLSYRGPAEDNGQYPAALVQKLRDPDAFGKTLDLVETKVNEAANGKIKIESLDAGKFKVKGVQLPAMGGMPASLAWTIRDGIFYLSTLEALDAAISQVEDKHESITANTEYKAALATLPDVKPLAITFSEPAKLYPSMYRTLEGVLPMARLAGLDLPPDLLPSPEKVAPFMTPCASIMWSEPDGFHFASRSAFPGAEMLGEQMSPGAVVGVTAMGTAILLPSLGKARELANRSYSAANLHGIAQSAIVWSAENNDALPDSLGRMILSDQISPKQLISKRSGNTPLEVTDAMKAKAKDDFASFAKEVDAHSDYVYLGKGTTNTTDASVVMAYEKPQPGMKDGINLVFMDAHSEFTRWSALPEAFKATNEYRAKLKLDPVDVDALVKAAQSH